MNLSIGRTYKNQNGETRHIVSINLHAMPVLYCDISTLEKPALDRCTFKQFEAWIYDTEAVLV